MVNEDEWRALAAQNPMRVTYPSWRTREQRLSEAKADPWRCETWNRKTRQNERNRPRYVGKKIW